MSQYPNINIIVEDTEKVNDILDVQLELYSKLYDIPEATFTTIRLFVASFVDNCILLWRQNNQTGDIYTEYFAEYNISNSLRFKLYLRIKQNCNK